MLMIYTNLEVNFIALIENALFTIIIYVYKKSMIYKNNKMLVKFPH